MTKQTTNVVISSLRVKGGPQVLYPNKMYRSYKKNDHLCHFFYIIYTFLFGYTELCLAYTDFAFDLSNSAMKGFSVML